MLSTLLTIYILGGLIVGTYSLFSMLDNRLVQLGLAKPDLGHVLTVMLLWPVFFAAALAVIGVSYISSRRS